MLNHLRCDEHLSPPDLRSAAFAEAIFDLFFNLQAIPEREPGVKETYRAPGQELGEVLPRCDGIVDGVSDPADTHSFLCGSDDRCICVIR